MPVIRGLYGDGSFRKPFKGYHSHISLNGAPLCKLDKKQQPANGGMYFQGWSLEEGKASCPACRKLAKQQLIGGAV